MIENTKQNILLFFSSNFCICFDIWISRITITQLICHDFGAKTWNLSFKTNSTQTHTQSVKIDLQKLHCKNWKLRQKHQIHLCFLRWHICQERGRKERLEINRPVGLVSIDWFCQTVLTIVKMKEVLSNYSSVYKRRDDFFVYKGQSIMGLILEVDRIGLSHGEALW